MTKPDTKKYSLFPKSLAGCVEQVTKPLVKAQAKQLGIAGSRLLTEWPSIVGPKLAKHAFPEKLSFPRGKNGSGGTLHVAAENGFATELHYLQPIILERLACYFGYSAISRIVITHASFTHALAEKPLLPARKATLPAACAMAADSVSDPELKLALISLAKTFSQQPG